MPDVRIINESPIDGDPVAAQVRKLTRANPLLVAQVNISGDVVNPGGAGGSGGDGAINDGADSGIKATVKNYANSKPLVVALANVSGDIYNSSGGGGGGVASDVNINQVGGVATSVNIGNADNATLRTVLASDQPNIPARQHGAWATAVTGDINLQQNSNRIIGRVESPIGVQVVGTSVGTQGVSGDVYVNQRGAWSTAISGDVSLQQNQDRIIGRIAGPLGVQIVGGQGIGTAGITGDITLQQNSDRIIGRIEGPIGVQVVGTRVGTQAVSGDVAVYQRGAWATAVTGDVSLQQNSNRIIGRIESPISTQVVGWPGTIGISGDQVVNVVQRGAWAVGITGDVNVAVTIADIITVGNVVGTQIVGGSIGGTVALSGDSTINSIQRGGWAVAVTGDPIKLEENANRVIGRIASPLGVQIVGGSGIGTAGITGDVSLQQNSNRIIGRIEGPIGVQIVGSSGSGTVGISGDNAVSQKGGWSVAVSGDVNLQQNSNRVIGRIESPISVQVVGYSGTAASQSVTGDVNVTATNLDIRDLAQATDQIGAHQKGAWAVAVTGDMILQESATRVIGRIAGPLGVQIVGGGGHGTVGVSGDVQIRPSTTSGLNKFAVSGDSIISDGADPSIKATVKDYANSNPLVVALANVSGDIYNALGSSSGGDGAILDGVDSGIKATVKDYTNSNPLTVVLVNVSGDVYNSGGGSGGDGAINDADNSAIKANVLSNSTDRPTSTQNPLLVQTADNSPVAQLGAWASAITGDVMLQQSSTRVIGRVEGPIGVQIVGGTGHGSVGVTGDVNVIQRGAWAVAVSGDRSITDGADSTIKATVKNYSNSKPLTMVSVNASGDADSSGFIPRVRSGTYGNKNVTTSATLIVAENLSRLATVVQNMEDQQVFIGLSSSLTPANGMCLAPTLDSSGDGGVFTASAYTGPIYGIVASGDVDVRYVEI